MELGLALVKLVQVCHLKSYAGVGLVNFHGQRILDSLYGEVLAHRAELLVYVTVVSLLFLPLLGD